MSSAARLLEIIPGHRENDSGIVRKPFAFPPEPLFAFSPETDVSGHECVRYKKELSIPRNVMGLLSPELEFVLPPLRSQQDESEPMVYAHYAIPDRPWSFYVTEGQRHGRDYTFFGFLIASEDEQDWQWSTQRLSGLECLLAGSVVRDETFIPGRLTDVVVLPR